MVPGAVNVFLSRLPRGYVLAASAASLVVLGYLDVITGFEAAFSIFYLIPVVAATWYCGAWSGYLFGFLSAAVWTWADILSGSQYSYPAIAAWNGTVRFGFYFIVTKLLSGLQAALKREHAAARHDGITGLLNYRGFMEAVEEVWSQPLSQTRTACLAVLDMDNFKAVNDTLGHSAGDELLRKFASTLRSEVRSQDIVARTGGDEFAVLMPGATPEIAHDGFAKVRARLETVVAGLPVAVTTSIGVVACDRPFPPLDEVLKDADAAMYEVKRTGKNRVLVRNFGRPVEEHGKPEPGA